MPSKRAQVPEEPFAKRPSALDKLTGADAPAEGGTATPQDRDTVIPSNSTTVMQHGEHPRAAMAGKAANEKISFYLRPDQVDKLDELGLAYKKRTGIRLNRNELVRRLIDRADLQLLDTAERRDA